MSSQDSTKKYEDKIKQLDTKVTVGDQNGLFLVQPKVTIQPILDKLKEARKNIDTKPPDFPNCDHNLSLAASDYFKAVHYAPRLWKFQNIYAGHLFIYLVLVLSTIFVYYYNFGTFLVTKLNITQLAFDATMWGVIGGILRGLWWLWYNVNRGSVRKSWIVWFVSTPFIGGILGALVFLIVSGGLLVITGKNTEISNPLAIMVLSALAGFNWEWAIGVIRKVENLINEKK